MKIIYRSVLAAALASTAAYPAFAENHVDAGTLTCAQFAALNSDDQMEALHVLTEMSGEMATDEMSSDAMESDDAMEPDDAMESDDAMAADVHTLDAVLSNCAANPDMMAMDAVELG